MCRQANISNRSDGKPSVTIGRRAETTKRSGTAGGRMAARGQVSISVHMNGLIFIGDCGCDLRLGTRTRQHPRERRSLGSRTQQETVEAILNRGVPGIDFPLTLVSCFRLYGDMKWNGKSPMPLFYWFRWLVYSFFSLWLAPSLLSYEHLDPSTRPYHQRDISPQRPRPNASSDSGSLALTCC